LLLSGELCSICGIGIANNNLKISQTYNIPLILTGEKVTETNTIYFEKIYDTKRIRAILSRAPDLCTNEINRFLIYPNLHPYKQKFLTYIGVFGRVLHPLYYQDQQNDDEIGTLLTREIGWIDAGKHADCAAEGFSNYIREHRYGYSRRVAYLSNKIRMGELSREDALKTIGQERAAEKSSKVIDVMKELDLDDNDLITIINNEKLKYQSAAYGQNRYINKAIRFFEKHIWK
jgi:hypothetical protein